MQNVVNYVKQYIGVISIVLAICILLSYSLSYFKVNIDNKRAAEMYVGELKYSITYEKNTTNTLTIPVGETIVDLDITNLNDVKTYFKLLYKTNPNVVVTYFKQTKDTSSNITNYLASGDSLDKGATDTLKLKILNNSSSDQTLTLKVSGGYSTNTLDDVEVPSSYSEISLEPESTNTYFCKTSDTISEGIEYVDNQYTYRYMQEGEQSENEQAGDFSYDNNLYWKNMTDEGWGVQLTDKASTSPVTGKLCTYINDKPVVSMRFMLHKTQASSIDFSSFNTSNVTNMEGMFFRSGAAPLNLTTFDTSKVTNMVAMFWSSEATSINVDGFNTDNVINMTNMFGTTKAKILNLSSFDTSKVTNMTYMFFNSKSLKTIYASSKFVTTKVTNSSSMFSMCSALVGGNGTKYDENYIDKTYARIDTEGTPGYFTLKSN